MEKNKREEIKGLRQHMKLSQHFNVGRFFQCLAICFFFCITGEFSQQKHAGNSYEGICSQLCQILASAGDEQIARHWHKDTSLSLLF